MKIDDAKALLAEVRKLKDRGAAGDLAKLRRGMSSALDVDAWSVLGRWTYPYTESYMDAVSAVVGAYVRGGCQNGPKTFAAALAVAEDEPRRLSRLLNAQSTEELTQLIRPFLSFVQSKSDDPVDYEQLLYDITNYNLAPQQIRERWAADAIRAVHKKEKEAA